MNYIEDIRHLDHKGFNKLNESFFKFSDGSSGFCFLKISPFFSLHPYSPEY